MLRPTLSFYFNFVRKKIKEWDKDSSHRLFPVPLSLCALFF
jgi:hypothetical protein